ncbi:hypothetical protein ACRAWD_24790 [Caulobacter segnis]
MNVNFPALAPEKVTEVEVTRQGFRDGSAAQHGKAQPTCAAATTIGWAFRPAASQPGRRHRLAGDPRSSRISVTPLHIGPDAP